MKRVIALIIAALFVCVLFAPSAFAAKKVKSKFYDFSDQILDGYIKNPAALYTDARLKVKFARLLKLKKDVLPLFLSTSRDRALR